MAANRNPAKPLTPQQRRRRRQDKDPLYNPAASLRGSKLASAAERLVALEYAPKLAALGREARSAETQGTALIDRSRGYRGQVAARDAEATDRQRAIAAELGSGLGRVAADSRASATADETDLLARLASDRALRGEGLQGGGDDQLQRELAARRTRSGETAQIFESAGALQGTRAAALQSQIAGANQARGQEVDQQLVNRLASQMADVRSRRSELEGQRGNARTKTVLDLRQQQFENQLTRAGLGLKEADLAAEIANQRVNQELARERVATTRRGQTLGSRDRRRGQDLSSADRQAAEQGRQRRAAEKAREKAVGKPPTARALKGRTAIEQARAMYQRFDGDYAKYVRSATRNKVPGPISQAAYEMELMGGITAQTRKRLRDLGVTVPRGWYATDYGGRT